MRTFGEKGEEMLCNRGKLLAWIRVHLNA